MGLRSMSAFVALAAALLAACSGGTGASSTTVVATASTTAPVASTMAPTTLPPTTLAPTTLPATTTTSMPAPPTLLELMKRGRVSIAHAGGELEGPDETLFTFRQALANGADVLEMNLQLSADGQVVLHHDATVDGKTNGTGPVVAKTAAELNALDAAYWWVPEVGTVKGRPASDYQYRGVRTGERPPPAGAEAADFGVPTFQQVVDAFPEAVFDVEMEAEAGAPVAPALAKAITDNGLQDRVVVSSFDDGLMGAFKQLLPDVVASPGLQVMTGFYTTPGPLPGYQILQVPPKFGEVEVLTDAFIAAAKANGLLLWVWPNDDALENEAAYRQFLARGLDGVIADRPSVMAALEG